METIIDIFKYSDFSLTAIDESLNSQERFEQFLNWGLSDSFYEKLQKLRAIDYGKEYAGREFIFHLDDVINLVYQSTVLFDEDEADEAARETLLLAAAGHDLIEDAPRNARVVFDCGLAVTKFVHSVTDCVGENRKETKRLTYDKYQSVLDYGDEEYIQGFKIIKAADRLANFVRAVETGHRNTGMYVREHNSIMRYLAGAPVDFLLERAYTFASIRLTSS